jgi:hypothetical protein
MKRFVLSVVREISIVWTDAKMDALMRRDHEVFSSGAEIPNHVSSELQDQVEQISRVINDMIEKIELLDQKLSLGN